MSSTWPAVTCVISTYKRPSLLRRALGSIFVQTYKNYEVIVVYDGPADDATVTVCHDYHKRFEEIDVLFTFISTAENSGYQCVPKNIGAQHAIGDYIAYLDDDNAWTDDHLEVLVNAIEEGEVWPDFVYGRREYVDTRGFTDPPLPTGISEFIPFDARAKELLGHSPLTNFIDTSDTLVTRGALWWLEMATGEMWKESLRRFGDWELFTRGVFFAGWRGKGVDHVVQRYYWHGDNLQLTRRVSETPQQVPV